MARTPIDSRRLVEQLPRAVPSDSWNVWAERLLAVLTRTFSNISAILAGVVTAIASDSKAPNCGTTSFSTLTSGEVMVKTKLVTSTCLIFAFPQAPMAGNIYEDLALRNPGVSFTLKSTYDTDLGPLAWLLIEPI